MILVKKNNANSEKTEEIRFSNAFLVEKWGQENRPEFGTRGRASGKTANEKAVRQSKIAKREGGRNYKGTSGRISKDGSQGYFDVDSKGRLICV